MSIILNKPTVTDLYCQCMSIMDRRTDWEGRVYVTCTDVTCPLHGKKYEIPAPFVTVVLKDYVPNEQPKANPPIKLEVKVG